MIVNAAERSGANRSLFSRGKNHPEAPARIVTQSFAVIPDGRLDPAGQTLPLRLPLRARRHFTNLWSFMGTLRGCRWARALPGQMLPERIGKG
ncbi:hypothetical protein [Novosphingobium rosa]|uniref:hypothetical protein n=1 Tax=Novosphingobium rosa TaxID=76978 RepID=UPI0012EEC057|nr:hypothetical protein [Novosphingobium rosa]